MKKNSAICNFYQDQTIFVTGATGFLGKVLVEKLLRTCHPKRIFVLIRSKKGKDPEQRMEELFQDPVFDRLKAEVPEFLKSVTGLSGDVSLPNLGLTEDSRNLIKEIVTVVIHGAATVRFDEKLKLAIDINVRGTKSVMTLCNEIINLKSVTHISTAYSYCKYNEIDEKFYDPPISPESLITLSDCVPEDQLNAMTPILIEKWPNTYSFTKGIAEEVVRTYGKNLPLAMFRPAIVIGASEEPVKGWIDNLYGPTGVMVGVGAGVMRTLYGDINCRAELVPVDLAVNALLTITYETTLNQPSSNMKIYNFASSLQNPLSWAEFMEMTMRHGKEVPSSQAVWYYTLTVTSNWYIYLFLTFFFHTIPALFIDLVLMAVNSKTRMLKVYSKIHKFTEVISYFTCLQWTFHNSNTQMLMSNVSEEDKKLFNFDLNTVNWDNYFKENVKAVRTYIFKESLDTIPRARVRMFWLHILHRAMQILLVVLTLWALKAIFF